MHVGHGVCEYDLHVRYYVISYIIVLWRSMHNYICMTISSLIYAMINA